MMASWSYSGLVKDLFEAKLAKPPVREKQFCGRTPANTPICRGCEKNRIDLCGRSSVRRFLISKVSIRG
jgi:hypothetical protein